MALTQDHITMDDGVRLFYERVGVGANALLILNGFFLLNDFEYLADGRAVIAVDFGRKARSDKHMKWLYC